MLVPLLGLAVVGGFEIRDRLQSRHASTELEGHARHLADIADFLAALASEEVHATVVALAHEIDLPEDHEGLRFIGPRLADARAVVDGPRFDDLRREARLDPVLRSLRAAVDAGSIGSDDARLQFSAVDELLETVWGDAMDDVERSGDEEPLPAHLRARVRSLRESMRTFSHADERIQPAIALLLGPPDVGDVRALLEATAKFELARELAEADAGPRAAQRWAAIERDGAFERTEQIIAMATDIGTGAVPPITSVDPGVWVRGLQDGAAWATRLTDVVRAAALDLEGAAANRAHDDSRSVTAHATVIALLALVSVGLAVVIARRVARPASSLEVAARRIQGGDLDLPSIEPAGPRELVATIHAFNDMASTLAAVERHTSALAEAPDGEILEEPLPGLTGLAMQPTIDRLRTTMTQAEAQRAELHERATHDGLTGLLNRAAAYAAIERELARAGRAGDELLALYVDLDGLKVLNDTHGHAAGDEAIVRTADALRATTRDADIVARLGGDEFLVVGPVPPDGRAGIEAFAERIRAAVSLQAVHVGGFAIPLRCSIGVVRSRAATPTAGGLVRAADMAMYRAKHGGRDRVICLDDVDDPRPATT